MDEETVGIPWKSLQAQLEDEFNFENVTSTIEEKLYLNIPNLEHNDSKNTNIVPNGQSYACKSCESFFAFKKNLNKHYKTKHEGVRFSCDECEAVLESKGLFDAHKYSHEEKRAKSKYYCDDCDETCSSKEDLENHMKREHDDGAWTCNDRDY